MPCGQSYLNCIKCIVVKQMCVTWPITLIHRRTCFRYLVVCHAPVDQHHEVQLRMISVDNFFVFFEIIIFCCVVAICDLVHDVETIFHLSYVLTASGNLF